MAKIYLNAIITVLPQNCFEIRIFRLFNILGKIRDVTKTPEATHFSDPLFD